MDARSARALSVTRSPRATFDFGQAQRLNNYDQRPREVPFSLLLSFGHAKESRSY